jgi:cytochrome P450
VFVSQWVMHRDPRYFEEPERFNPDRWTEEFEKSLPRLVYFPFGGGPRFCIGQTFATTEAILVLAAICQRFRFFPDTTFQLALWPNITLRPKSGLRVRVERSDARQTPDLKS